MCPPVVFLLLGALLPGSARPAPDSAPPSVLLLTVDTLRPDYLSLNGYDRPTTPFLDGLIAGGYYFEEAVSPIPRTTPALASLLTGAYPHRTGVRSLLDALGDGVVPLAEVLRGDGYQTLAVVTNWVLERRRRLDRGFLSYDTAHDSRTARETTDIALSRMRQLDPERPAFLWIHYIDPHVPYHSDPAIAERFDPGYRGPYRHNFGWQPRPGGGREAFSAFPKDLPKRLAVHRNPLPEDVNRHVRRLYAADVRFLDDHLERLVAGVRERFGPDLLIVFTSDHGESLGEHAFYYDHGDYAYNAGMRVPMALVLPDSHPLAGSGRVGGWVSLVDVVPTLFELLGRKVPAKMAGQIEGRSLVPALRGKTLPPAPVFAECGHSRYPDLVRRRVRNDVAGRFRAVTYEDWKLIWTPFQSGDAAWELYNVREDPHETRNLYRPDHPRVPGLRKMLSRWVSAGERAGQPGAPAQVTPEDIEALRALGYVD